MQQVFQIFHVLAHKFALYIYRMHFHYIREYITSEELRSSRPSTVRASLQYIYSWWNVKHRGNSGNSVYPNCSVFGRGGVSKQTSLTPEYTGPVTTLPA